MASQDQNTVKNIGSIDIYSPPPPPPLPPPLSSIASSVPMSFSIANSSPPSSQLLSLSMSPTSVPKTPREIQIQPHEKSNNFEPIEKSSSNTLKRNPKMELNKTDLLKLLGHLEGELQARDIVIAALKSEKMKNLLSSRYRSGTADPHAALARDVAIVGGMIRMENNRTDNQVASLEALVTQQRRMQCRMAKVLKDAEIRHRAVIKELEEEKCKHEHDTAQGDDITYGLEKERTRLKMQLGLERLERKRLETELKKEAAASELQKLRQKQIVLLLLAERKKIIMKYIEERKRSEDLAQILSEEKVRIDSMAEGLEEESKKSLQMEAELEKQQVQFDIERQQYHQALAKAEKREKELEADLEGAKTEMELWRSGATTRSMIRPSLGVTPPPPPAKPANLAAIPALRPAGNATHSLKGPGVLGTGTPMVSSKVVQPTATVSSVPVSGPTTGIARSVTPRQAIRGVTYGSIVTPIPLLATTITATVVTSVSSNIITTTSISTTPIALNLSSINTNTTQSLDEESIVHESQIIDKRMVSPLATPDVSLPLPAIPIGTTLPTSPASSISSSTMKLIFHPTPTNSSQTTLSIKKSVVPRGIPPPVPPNKPAIPPKKDTSVFLRKPDSNQQMQDPSKSSKAHATCQQQSANLIPSSGIRQALPSTSDLIPSQKK